MTPVTTPQGVLLVGSIPLHSPGEVFTKISSALTSRLYSIPDGETGDRGLYVKWQLACFPQETWRDDFGGKPLPNEIPKYTLESIGHTRYDEAAIASYAEFCRLRDQGVIQPGVRFQVCLPSPYNVILGLLKPEVHVQLEPFYEARLQESVASILKHIPASDLVIQWDMCFEVMALEYEQGRLTHDFYKAYFSPVTTGTLERLVRVLSVVPRDVPQAFHLCYGDLGHKHFVEPVDAALLVDLANDIVSTLKDKCKVEWVHLPVPRDRTDVEYFKPLSRLQLGNTRLFLGLVHANDEDGTRKRVRSAQSAYPHSFGIATECGMGRTPREEVDSILDISRAVAAPFAV